MKEGVRVLSYHSKRRPRVMGLAWTPKHCLYVFSVCHHPLQSTNLA